jgi:uncharacterized protein (TIGR02001 family)
MKMKQKLIASAIALSSMAGFAVPAAHAEVSASVGAGNMYYWRGKDLGNGDASVWGDLKYSESGFYTGIWGGSGDAGSGTEYDIYAGYGGTAGDFKYDFSLWTYSYPKTGVELAPGDLSEAVLMLGYGPVAATYYKNIAGASSYSYVTLAATFDKFTVKYGQHSDNEDASMDGMAHVDVTYAFNEKVSFTIGKVVDDADGSVNDEAKFVVGLTLPIE